MNRELWAIDNMFTFAILIDGVHKMKFRNYHSMTPLLFYVVVVIILIIFYLLFQKFEYFIQLCLP